MFNEINQNDLNEEVMHQVMQFSIEQNFFITCNFNENEVMFSRLSQFDYLILNFSSISGRKVHGIENIFTDLQENNDFNTDRLRIIIRALNNCTAISYLNLGADISQLEIVDMVTLIANNKFMEYLYLPKVQNSILNGKVILKMIIDTLKSNKSLQYVDMSLITIDSDLISDIVVVINNNDKLKEMKLSKLIIRHNDFEHLGNYLVKITGLKSLNITGYIFNRQITGLKSLNITGYIFNRQDADKLTIAIKQNFEIWQLNLSNCKVPIDHLLCILSYKSVMEILRWLDLSSCHLHSKEMKQILIILKLMNCLQHVNLSANIMESDAVNNVAAMIENNQDIQVLSLPNCVLNQKDLMIIIQAMQTVSSLEYVNFNNNTVDNELASVVALLFTKNSKLKEFRCTKLALNQIGFHHLNNYLVKIKGLTAINIIGCSFIGNSFIGCNGLEFLIAISSNTEIQELNLSNCRFLTNQLSCILSCIPKLKYLNLSQCLLQPNETKSIFGILKGMKCLQHVDLSANNMESNSVSDVAAMIKNNEHIQSLSLPNGIISKEDFKIIIKAMQTVSSLQYLDFSANEIDDELANDISALFASNSKLKEINFYGLTLKQSGFQHLMIHFTKLKGIKCLSISDCTFTNEDVVYLNNMIENNHNIRKMLITNCKMLGYGVIIIDKDKIGQLETLVLNNISTIGSLLSIPSMLT